MDNRPRIVQLNLAYDPSLTDAEALLHRYATLVEWSDALVRAGGDVSVVLRHCQNTTFERQQVRYHFVRDDMPPRLGEWSESAAVRMAVVNCHPDVVHINGLMFPAMTKAVRAVLPRSVIVLQDHSGYVPRLGWPFRHALRRRWKRAFEDADAVTFTARELAEPWHRIGLPGDAAVMEIVEASTTFSPLAREEARALTGVHGAPAILWVGRLNRNKDPLTVIAGLELVFARHSGARCWMIYTDAPLEQQARAYVQASPALRDRIHWTGTVPHASMAAYHSAADIFVSGSHHEGSGYALIESLACGVVPVVTDIPAFRAIAGGCGRRWRPGDPQACADALHATMATDLSVASAAARGRFVQHLTWDEIATRTLDAYRRLMRQRETRRP